MNNVISSENEIAFHPGYYIKKYIDSQGMSQNELSNRMKVSEKTVSELINGKSDLTDNLIEKLSLSIGTSKELWRNLNNSYRDSKNRVEIDKELQVEKSILNNIDYKFFEKLNCVVKTSDPVEKVSNLKRFFKISSLSVLKKPDFLVQFRTAVNDVQIKNIINANAWVQTALNIGTGKQVSKINIDYLKSHLFEIRSMTLEDPSDFIPRLNQIFEKSGIKFVLLPNLTNCGINGAVKWIGSNKENVLLAMNNRRKYADVFWFSLFHEIKHVLQQKRGHIIVTTDNNDKSIDSPLNIIDLEKEADNFATNILIDPKEYSSFIKKGNFSRHDIIDFSKRIKINPGIVVGRLQRDKYLNYNVFNDLKIKYNIV